MKELVANYLRGLMFTPYIYGGQGPLGIDCSGLIIEGFRAIGLIGAKADFNAQGLHDYFSALHLGMSIREGELGALAFFGRKKSEIVHVGFCLNDKLMIEAGGGDKTVTDLETAKTKNAFVRMRPLNSKRDLVAIILPFY